MLIIMAEPELRQNSWCTPFELLLTCVESMGVCLSCDGLGGSDFGQQFGESLSRVALLNGQLLSHSFVLTDWMSKCLCTDR